MYSDGILVLDFGGLEARSVARRLRSELVYSELLPGSSPVERIQNLNPKGIVLAGGEGDAFASDAPAPDPGVFALGLPVLGLGYGARSMLKHMGAKRIRTEYGAQTIQVAFEETPLFEGLTESERVFDRLDVFELPDGVLESAKLEEGLGVAFADEEKRLYGMQFYPETNDPDGLLILRNFACAICGAEQNWTIDRFLEQSLEGIQRQLGDSCALIAISGGVDSAVCAALMHRAIGDRLRCLHVDTGLMRKGEREQVEEYFTEIGMQLNVVDARERFIQKLGGITDNERKYLVVRQEYEHVLREVATQAGIAEYLVQGTIYNDVLDGVAPYGALQAGDLGRRGLLVEPIRVLFKEEVRELGTKLGLPDGLVNRQPFPSAGLAVRCMGEVNLGKLSMLQDADEIVREEIAAAGLDKRIRQYFAVLTDIKTSGVPNPGYAVVIRALNSGSGNKASVYRLPYDLLERIVERITKEVKGVNRVVYDVTGYPPASIEWD